MARRSNGPTNEERAPETDQSSTGYNPFLKVEDLDKSGPTRLELTGWVRRTMGRFGPQIVIEVKHPDGRTYDLGVKDGSPNHRMLWRGLGRDESQWAGYIVVEVAQFEMRNGRKSNPAIDIREVQSDNPPF